MNWGRRVGCCGSDVLFERGSGEFGVGNQGPDLRVLDGIASWCGGLHGSMSLEDSLKSLAVGFGAEAAVISRHQRMQDRPRQAAMFDVAEGQADVPVIRRPLCTDVLGYFYRKARASTVWFLTDHRDDAEWTGTQTLVNWSAARDIKEIAVVVLGDNQQQRDCIEFHFIEELAYSQKLELETLVPTLVRAWAGRKSGLVTQAQMDERMVRARAAAQATKLKPNAPILGMSNPAGLSRAEFRVCLLFSRGLSVKAVTQELGLSESTIRSHLRSIYSKTEVSGMQELMYRILSSDSEAADVHRKRG